MTSAYGIEIISRGVCLMDGYVLLCHGRGHDSTYLPGGHIEKGESAVTALQREIKEEMGIDSCVNRFLGVVENRFKQKGRKVDEINLLFELAIPGLAPGTDIPVAEDWLDFRWERMENIDAANVKPDVMRGFLRKWWRDPVQPGAGWASNYQ